ncbi:penicillin acylase family protein [Paracoccus pacificus]|uniref:Penicillin acylase family protein n=1 Tax=Paracoccus pacificus TaxID=1463598 RepID=A0ABW4R8C4_9RHOB
MLLLFRWLLRLTIGLIILTVLGILAVWYFAIRSLPDYNASLQVSGISAPVEIVRTTENVPHIFGASDRDVYFALGLAHAQDRLFQMTLLRRAAEGRLSEIYGARAFAADDLVRRMGLYRAAQAQVAAQTPETQEALAAYADGVNAWLAQVNKGAMGRGAPEFFLYPDDFSLWQPADSLAILNLLAAAATDQAKSEVLRARLSIASPQFSGDLVAGDDEPPMPAYARLFPGLRLPQPETDAAQNPSREWDDMLAGFVAPGMGASANAWAAAPRRTAAGGALLANDIQVPLTAPSLWYLARLELRSGGVIGGTIPGIPAVIVGRNPKLAWGITPAHVDDQDLLIEELDPSNPNRYRTPQGWRPMESRKEIIRIRDAQPVTITLRRTENGPVMPLAPLGLEPVLPPGHVAVLQWTGAQPGDTTLSALHGLMKAQGRDDAMKAAALVVAPAVSLTLADSGGVSELLAGALPARNPAHQTAGRMPAPGWVPENRWQGLRPADSAPRIIDPESGIVEATGDAQPGGAFPDNLGHDWGDSQRIKRLSRLMAGRDVHTRESFIAAQLDTVSPAARALLPLTGADLWFTGEPAATGTPERMRQDALALLAEWDGNMSEHLPEPLIYAAWMAELQYRLIRDELGPVVESLTALRPAFIERVFRNTNGASRWCDVVQSAPVEDCATIARQSLDAALLDLSSRYGDDVASWRWGDAHQAIQLHPALGRVPGLRSIFDIQQSTSGGDFTMAKAGILGRGRDAWRNITGAGYRGVYDLADPDSSVFIISTGQSGHPLSRHYDDLAELWRRGEYIGMSLDPELARAGAVGITRLTPSTQ